MVDKKPAKKPAAKKSAAKPAAKKPVAKKAAPKAPKVEIPIGRVTHYFDKIKVAVINLEKGKTLKVGDSLRIEGGEVNHTQVIESMQVDHENVKQAKAGDDFAIKLKKKVHDGYRVYKA